MKITEAFERGEFVVTAEVERHYGSECNGQSVLGYAPWFSGNM